MAVASSAMLSPWRRPGLWGAILVVAVAATAVAASGNGSMSEHGACHDESQCEREAPKGSARHSNGFTKGAEVGWAGPGAPTVVSPAAGSPNDLAALMRWCTNNREEAMRLVYRQGGVLWRGWDVSTVNEAEQMVFGALGLSPMSQYPDWFLEFNERALRLGVPAPGGLTQRKRSRTIPVTEALTMQCPHVEYFNGPKRPRAAGFFVEIPPAVLGTTAMVYFPEAIERLSPELYALLRDNGWWSPRAGVVQPSLLVHPETGLEGLQLNTFSSHLAPLALEAYQYVRAHERPGLPEVLDVPYTGPDTFPITLVRPNGTHFDLSRDQELELLTAILSTTTEMSWQAGDIFLFDNVLHGHFRLPGEQPRRLHGIFGDEVDTRTFRREDAPACVHEGSKAYSKDAVGVALDWLGLGGNRYILWITMQMPDVVFQWLGRNLWAGGSGGFSTAKPKADDG